MSATIERNNLDTTLISPRHGAKYSHNLFEWLNAEHIKKRVWMLRVYRETNGKLWIGVLDKRELIGANLISVLCNGAREQTAAWQGIEAVEVPDFWANYISDGRCAIDPSHTMNFIDDGSRWAAAFDERSCRWCGTASQTLKRWTEVVHREQWVDEE